MGISISKAGLAPAANPHPTAPAETIGIEHTLFGEIAEKQLFLLKDRYPHLTVDQYVIMPDHIHAIMVLNQTARASPRPTITDIVCAYKSLTARECQQNGFTGKLFQTSFHEHIIRDQKDYEMIVNYIYENPLRRYLRSL